MNCGAYVVDAVVYIVAAAVVMISQTPTLVAGVADEGARWTGLVGNEGDRRQVRHRPLKARGGARSAWRHGVEAWWTAELEDEDRSVNVREVGAL
jgi:hypothetical protein